MNKIISVITIAVSVIIAISCTSENTTSRKSEKKSAVVTINPNTVLRSFDQAPIGMNINFYLDSDKATNAPVTITEAIKNLGVKFLRYPGGDKSDEYLFAYPPYDKAQPHPTRTGPNSSIGRGLFMNPDNGSEYKYPPMDFDEFMDICHETNCEPIIVVAADTRNHPFPEGVTGVSTVEEMMENAVEWVRYANIKKQYNIKYWMIGNECWHENVNEYYSVDDYVSDIHLFSDAMRAVDPSIQIIANVAVRGNFTEKVIKEAGDKIDMLCISNYPFYNSKYEDWSSGKLDVLAPYKLVRKQVKAYASADKRDINIIVAEYGPFDFGENGWKPTNDLGHALCNFDMAGKMLLEDRIPFSCYWNTRWLYDDDKSAYNLLDDNNNILPVGQTLAFWTKHLYPVMIQAETSKSDLTVFSSYDSNLNQAFIYVINKSTEAQSVALNVKDREIKECVQVAKMFGSSPEDFNPVIDESHVPVETEIELSPYSIHIFKLNFK